MMQPPSRRAHHVAGSAYDGGCLTQTSTVERFKSVGVEALATSSPQQGATPRDEIAAVLVMRGIVMSLPESVGTIPCERG